MQKLAAKQLQHPLVPFDFHSHCLYWGEKCDLEKDLSLFVGLQYHNVEMILKKTSWLDLQREMTSLAIKSWFAFKSLT